MRTFTINAAGISDSRSGVGDVYLGPLVLGWHGPQWTSGRSGMWFDTAFSTSVSASPGKGFKSTMPTGGSDDYLTVPRPSSGAALMRYEFNATATAPACLRPADAGSGAWQVIRRGLGRSGGYSQRQTTNDSGAGRQRQQGQRATPWAPSWCTRYRAGVPQGRALLR